MVALTFVATDALIGVVFPGAAEVEPAFPFTSRKLVTTDQVRPGDGETGSFVLNEVVQDSGWVVPVQAVTGAVLRTTCVEPL